MKYAALVVVAVAASALTACQTRATTEPAAGPTSAAVAETTQLTLFVGPETAPCEGVGAMDCLQVRESPDEEWQLFTDTIDGFEYEPGYTYELVVQVTTVPSLPADASTRKYTLIGVANKTAATPSDAPTALALEGPTWRLATHGDPAAAIPVLEGTQITATFQDGRVTGTGGCNEYFASFEVERNRLAVQMPGSTMMACEEPVMEQEQAYLAALAQAASYEIVGTTLVITSTDAMALSYVAQAAGLDATAWTVTGYNNGQGAVVSPIVDTAITASFSKGQIAGSGGCNQYNAVVELDGNEITVGPPAATRTMCPEPEGVMEQETWYLEALQSAASWRRDGDRLELRTADDALAVTLVLATVE